MIIYHEISSGMLPKIKSEGLKRTARGTKSNEDAILRADNVLDQYIPPELQASGVSRNNTIYGYLGDESSLVDIQDGQKISLKKKKQQNGQVLLRLDVDPKDCWVSNLNAYDAVKQAIANRKSHQALSKLCKDYWNGVRPLNEYQCDIERPEIMITCNISPVSIEEV